MSTVYQYVTFNIVMETRVYPDVASKSKRGTYISIIRTIFVFKNTGGTKFDG